MVIQVGPTQTENPSERVRRLFAAMLKALVKSELGYDMRDGEALDLTGYGCLSNAITSIEKRIEINKQFPDSALRNTLAVQEAAILAGTLPEAADHARERILKAREEAFVIFYAKKAAQRSGQQARVSLRERMAEIRRWGRVHSRFVSGIEKVYLDTLSDLKHLNLPNHVLVQATTELDAIFETAIGFANGVRPSSS
jgi:hypothetical protein